MPDIQPMPDTQPPSEKLDIDGAGRSEIGFSTDSLGYVMKIFIQSTIRFLFITAVLLLGGILPSFSADLQMLSNARLINDPANDGDSFLLEANGKSFHMRLYLVDCPETSISFRSDAQRVREQTRYFGLSDVTRTIHFGNDAKTFTEQALLKPFTVHTAFASALGRSSKGRERRRGPADYATARAKYGLALEEDKHVASDASLAIPLAHWGAPERASHSKDRGPLVSRAAQ